MHLIHEHDKAVFWNFLKGKTVYSCNIGKLAKNLTGSF